MTTLDKILDEIGRVVEGSKIWTGMEWTYLPIHPFKYKKLRELYNQYWAEKK